jgi:hypothetical protein
MITHLPLLPDNEIEPRVRRPSVPVAKCIDGKYCWLKFGTTEYVHEPELEQILLAALEQQERRKAA